MEAWFKLPERTRRDICNQVSAETGLPASAIEKDWWVTLTLKAVFSLACAEHLVFKGGTSLSKGYGLIARFSEDIDLAIDRRFLGFEGDLTISQIKKLRKQSCSFISTDLLKQVEGQLNAMGAEGFRLVAKEAADTDVDPQVLELYYNSLTEDVSYLQPRVLIEVGARSLIEPHENKQVQSLIGLQYPNSAFSDTPVDIPIVLPKRTFLEKIFLLYEEFQKPVEKIRTERMSRHLYDLDQMMDTEHGKAALDDMELFESIVAHRRKFSNIRGVDYSKHQRATLAFIPPVEVAKEWERDYEVMRESMIYGHARSYPDLIERIEELKTRFKKAEE